jgi:DNA-binding NtrC family response regulator
VHVVPLQVPPLRERGEDVSRIAALALARLAEEIDRPPRPLTADAVERLWAYSWPGNVRELENVMERLVVLGDEGPITAEEVAAALPDGDLRLRPDELAAAPAADPLSLLDQERRLVAEALDRAGHNQSRAARLLKISRERLRTRMKRHGLMGARG